MKIDQNVEHAVRQAYAGAVGGEVGEFDSAVEAIAVRGNEFASRALTLAHAVNSGAMFSAHEGQRPDDEQLVYLTRTFTEQETDWIDLDEDVTRSYLTSLADRRSPLDDIALGDAMVASFAIGGWLLSAFLPEGGSWVDFLNQILDVVESVPVDRP